MSLPLRERKKTATRAAICASARRLFAERGYEATTVDDIAEGAVVSRRTFFRYFATKDDLVFADEEAILGLIRAGLDGTPADLPLLEAMEHGAGFLAEEFEGRREEFIARQAMVDSVPALALRAQAKHLRWQEVIAEVLLRRGAGAADAALAARVGIACFDLALRSWYTAGDRPLRHHVADAYARLRVVTSSWRPATGG